MHEPKEEHMEEAKHVLWDLKRNLGQGILLSGESNLQVSTYCDLD